MGKYKRSFVAFLGGILLFTPTAFAQFPVFDVPEFVPVGKDIKENLKNITDLKKQLMVGNETLNAIGKGINPIAMFDKDDNETDEDDVYSAVNSAQENAKDNEQVVEEISEKTVDEITETLTAQQEMTDDYINQIEQMLGVKEYSVNASSVNMELKDNVKLKKDTNLSFSSIEDRSIVVEEEEEEEEISVAQEEILNLQKITLNEQKQMATELVDVLEIQLTKINTSAEKNLSTLTKLNSTIQNMEKISEKDKQEINKKIETISQKQRKANDWAAQIIENAKENYNKEYNATIKDGMNNYTKVVLAYTKGAADKNDVINAGKKLKAEMKKINVTPDKGVLNELRQTVADVRIDIEKLGKEIDDILQNIEKIS